MAVKSPLKTVFLGSPRFAEVILEILANSPYRPILVITEPDRPVGRSQEITSTAVKLTAKKLGIPIAQPDSRQALTDLLQATQFDLGLVAAYGQILKPEHLAVPGRGFLNVHASLLPRYRGASPIQAAIRSGDIETGITIMEIDEGLDTGQIISWAATPISDHETTPTLTETLAEIGGALLVATIPDYLSGTILPRAQINSDASLTRLLTRNSGRLIGNESPSEIDRLFRAYTPWPGIWTEIDGQRLIIRGLKLCDDQLNITDIQLAGKNPVTWNLFVHDRPILAQKLREFLKLTD